MVSKQHQAPKNPLFPGENTLQAGRGEAEQTHLEGPGAAAGSGALAWAPTQGCRAGLGRRRRRRQHSPTPRGARPGAPQHPPGRWEGGWRGKY